MRDRVTAEVQETGLGWHEVTGVVALLCLWILQDLLRPHWSLGWAENSPVWLPLSQFSAFFSLRRLSNWLDSASFAMRASSWTRWASLAWVCSLWHSISASVSSSICRSRLSYCRCWILSSTMAACLLVSADAAWAPETLKRLLDLECELALLWDVPLDWLLCWLWQREEAVGGGSTGGR